MTKIINYLFIIMIFLLVAGILYAGPNQWTKTEGMNKPSFCMSLSPSDSNILFCTGSGYHSPLALFRSDDKGNTWSQVTQNNNLKWYYVFCSPENSSNLFMPDNKGLNRSIDGGYTFSLVTSGLTDGSAVTDMVYAYDSAKTLFAGSYSINKSTDGGETWSPASTGMGQLSYIHLSASPVDSSIMYATGEYGLYKSIDKGEHWSQLTSSTHSWVRIRVNPVNPDIVYAIPNYENYLIKSVDGGATWSLKTTGLPDWMLIDMVTVPGDGSTLFAASSNCKGVFFSTDTGETWQAMNNGFSSYPPTILQLLVIPGKSPTILAATPFGVYSYTLTSTSVDKKLWELYEEKE
jgi:hypothetical protein